MLRKVELARLKTDVVRRTVVLLPTRSGVAWIAALAIAVAMVADGQPAYAGNPVCEQFKASYTGGSARVQTLEIDGRTVRVLLPSDYDRTTAAYPVLYLLHGSSANPDRFLVDTDLIAFTADQPIGQQAIVVLPDGGQLPAWTDFPGSGRADESFFVDRLVPRIDARYRTIADGAHRAVAGFSLGGGGAIHLAARHPQLFAATASFSGAVDFTPENSPRQALFASGGGSFNSACEGDPAAVTRLGPHIDLVAHPLVFHNASPTDLAGNLGNTAVALFSGDGTPCPGDPPKEAGGVVFEVDDHASTHRLDQALTAEGVPHTFDDYGCGGHSYRFAERDIHAWWSTMTAAFGRPIPAVFDYRTADPSAAAWGWSFQADAGRAGEFLDLRKASKNGFSLVGSGLTRVTTAPLFVPDKKVFLHGATRRFAVADGTGRLTLSVDLGPAHTEEQYTALGRLAATRPGYFTTRAVTFRPSAADKRSPKRMRRSRPRSADTSRSPQRDPAAGPVRGRTS